MSLSEQQRAARSAADAAATAPTGAARDGAPAEATTYYQRPMVKRATWKWYIPLYFFLGGVAGGAAAIGAAADLFGGRRHRATVRYARYLSVALAPVCALLLILDLGRPERFHHMFRVFKGASPLSVGTWILGAFGLTSGVLAARQLAEDEIVIRRESMPGRLARLLPARPFAAAHGLLGLALGSYTGVLLAVTAIPLWAGTGLLLGPIFLTAAFTSGAAALSLIGLLTGDHTREERRTIETLANVGTVAQAALAVAREAIVDDRVNAPLRRGVWARVFQFGTVGVGWLLPSTLRLAARASSPRVERRLSLLAAVCALAGVVGERFAIVEAGKRSADDPLAYQALTRGDPGEARPTPGQQAWWHRQRTGAAVAPFQPHQVVPES
ncbi:MAG TPA: NrfD/PsrC family molybdoenzyme membrane anchor subunit [Ktedonobacterales bacterium]|jgi:formate-dependent nitrite reductase membrane component NrfD